MIQTWEIIEFAGANEITAVVRTQKDVTILQADPNRGGEQAQKQNMKFNVAKCEVMHGGKSSL